MKKYLALFFIFLLFLFSCKKNKDCGYTESGATATSGEITYLQNYINSNSITATQHGSGAFYKINNAGSGPSPDICSNITVKYSGYILGGSRFDTSANASFILGQLIPAWQKTLPLLNNGGSIVLYIPPSLAYGANDVRDNAGNIIIPGNSYLKFNIELLDVQ